jgi:hypothetical protein
MKPEVAKDLIELVNSLKDFVKSKSVKYGNTSFDYVPLDDILDRVKMNSRWAVMQPLSNDNGQACVETILVHESGEFVQSGKFPLFVNPNGKPQDMGALITYSKRYSLGAFLGLATETDNDANPDSEVKDLRVKDETLMQLSSVLKEADRQKVLDFYRIDSLGKLTEANAQKILAKKRI